MPNTLIIGLSIVIALAVTILALLIARIVVARRASRMADNPDAAPRFAFPYLPAPSPSIVRLQRMAQSPGLTLDELNEAAPVIPFVKKEGGEEENTCAVCLEEMEADAKTRRLPCRHEFDAKCIEDWVTKANRCPVCNTNVIEEESLHKARLAAIEGRVERDPNAPRQRRRRARGENGTFQLTDSALQSAPPMQTATPLETAASLQPASPLEPSDTVVAAQVH